MLKTSDLLKLTPSGSLDLNLPPEIAEKLGWEKGDLINISIVEDAVFLIKVSLKTKCCKDNFTDVALIQL